MNPNSALGRWIQKKLPRRLAAFVEEGAEYTVGVGPSLGAGWVIGANAGGGLFWHRNGMGHYGALGVTVGAIANASAGMHMTLVKGGPEAFLGACRVVGVGVSPAFTFVTALYTPEHELLGFSIDLSLGHALPVELCVGALKTYGRAWSSKRASA